MSMIAQPASATDLPPDGIVGHWTPRIKEAVLAAIAGGDITIADAMRRWRISVEELDLWLVGYRKRGRNGLKVTTIQAQGRLL